MLAHDIHMHVRGIEVIIGELMVPTFYFTNEKNILASTSLYYEVTVILNEHWLQTMIHKVFC